MVEVIQTKGKDPSPQGEGMALKAATFLGGKEWIEGRNFVSGRRRLSPSPPHKVVPTARQQGEGAQEPSQRP